MRVGVRMGGVGVGQDREREARDVRDRSKERDGSARGMVLSAMCVSANMSP